MRLVPGPIQGRAEVYRSGVWGTVCQSNFTYTSAKVVCNQVEQTAYVLTKLIFIADISKANISTQ